MTINSNEEFYPIDSQGDFYGSYYLVSKVTRGRFCDHFLRRIWGRFSVIHF